uniref:Uncharacterized protein n=1 Tax=Anguilla anguilla TaxID=7936 RepID=A0A0E9XL79_ANGAN
MLPKVPPLCDAHTDSLPGSHPTITASSTSPPSIKLVIYGSQDIVGVVYW